MIIPYEADYYPKTRNPITRFGRKCLVAFRNIGRALIIIFQAFLFIPFVYKNRAELARQMYLAGIRSFGVTTIVALFTGMILSLQAGLVLRDYHQEMKVGTLVCQTMCREMGPLMTALILAASVGSAMAAQIGTMKVSEEIAALEIMSINPVRYLVTPRLVAMLFMCPALTIYTNFIGTVGGGIVANTQLNVSWTLYYDNAIAFLGAKEIWIGVFKSIVFSIIIVMISCYQGMAATKGAVGVGEATRRSVVISFLVILIVGYFITRLFY